MNEITKCAKCGSDKIIPRVSLVERGHYNVPDALTIRVDEKPDALFFKSSQTGKLYARICGNCGYVETYVDNHEELYSAYLKSKDKG